VGIGETTYADWESGTPRSAGETLGVVAGMTLEDVVEVLTALDAGGIDYWVDGGWGIDALLARQTREHHDLDLGVGLDDVPKIETLLPQFLRESGESGLLLKDERGRVVDLLLVERSESGELWQQLPGGRRLRYEERETRASGFIGSRRVRCASVALQLEHHDHPDATDQDRLDIEALERELRDNAGRGPHRERRRIQRG
jgi:lincosamide nucleotidyltransferase A/C/D/E